MGRIRAAHLSASLGLIVALLPGVAGAQEPAVFTAEVNLVTIPVTVKDGRNAPIADLDREDFTILEEGEPREIAVFERRTNRPLSVALMLDASLSTAIELRYERESASRFLRGLLGKGSQPGDSAAVFSFSSDVEALADFTSDHREFEKALQRVRPETGTSVYDAIGLVSRVLQHREGRRVVIMITDGGDTTSHWTFADALRAAHVAEAAIYPLIVLPIRNDAGRNRGGEHALITLARNTGGETFVQHAANDLDEAFAQVLRILRTQYILGYYPQSDGQSSAEGFRGLEVRANRPGAVVLSRSGYFARPPIETDAVRPEGRATVRLRTVPQKRSSGSGAESAREVPNTVPKRRPDGQPRPPITRPDR